MNTFHMYYYAHCHRGSEIRALASKLLYDNVSGDEAIFLRNKIAKKLTEFERADGLSRNEVFDRLSTLSQSPASLTTKEVVDEVISKLALTEQEQISYINDIVSSSLNNYSKKGLSALRPVYNPQFGQSIGDIQHPSQDISAIPIPLGTRVLMKIVISYWSGIVDYATNDAIVLKNPSMISAAESYSQLVTDPKGDDSANLYMLVPRAAIFWHMLIDQTKCNNYTSSFNGFARNMTMSNPSSYLPMEPGTVVFIKTCTDFWIGKIVEDTNSHVVLDDCVWVAVTGRWSEFCLNGKPSEYEVGPSGLLHTIAKQGIMAYIPNWPHPIPVAT